MKQRAEIRTLSDALRHTTRITLTNESELAAFARRLIFLDFGSEAYVFKEKGKEKIWRVDRSWFPSRESERRFLSTSLLGLPKSSRQLEGWAHLFTLFFPGTHSQPKTLPALSAEIQERAAAHNAQFVRDPTTTVPVNELLYWQDWAVGMSMKYLRGIPAGERAAYSELRQSVCQDYNPFNVISFITNSACPTQIVDLRSFFPTEMNAEYLIWLALKKKGASTEES